MKLSNNKKETPREEEVENGGLVSVSNLLQCLHFHHRVHPPVNLPGFAYILSNNVNKIIIKCETYT